MRQDNSGSALILFALMLPVLLTVVAGAIDLSALAKQRRILQAAADTASLTGAKGLSLVDAKRDNVDDVVRAVVASFIDENVKNDNLSGYKVDTKINNSPLEVVVSIHQEPYTHIGQAFGITLNTLVVNSTARVIGQPNICVLALDPDASGAVSLFNNALVTGQGCSVFSNSTHGNSIQSKGSTLLRAESICSGGGVEGPNGNFLPQPLTDCPSFEDPLASRPEPTPGKCITTKEKIESDTVLEPGTYCGGLTIEDSAEVKLNPGVYIFLDGALTVTDEAKLIGEEVGLFFKGEKASMRLGRKSSISLSAPKSGIMAGLLLFVARDMASNLIYKIESDDARQLLGTLYLPNNELRIDANNPVADQSAYTAVIANTVSLYGGPHLILNTDYNKTSVPVPEGLKGVGQPVALVK